MSSTLSSMRSSPIPDLAYDSYRSLSLRDQTLIRRQVASAGGTGTGVEESPLPPSINGNNFQDYSSTSGTPQFQQGNGTEAEFYPANVGMMDPMSTSTLRSRPVTSSSSTTKIMTVPSNSSAVKRRPSSFFVDNGKAYNLDKYNGETLAFWILLAVLIVLVLANSILTFLVFGVVRVGRGMESIEFLPGLLKFYGDTDLDDIYKRDGILQGFKNQPIEIAGEQGGVYFSTDEGSQPSFSLEKGAINISKVKEFRVVDKKGKEIFSTNTPTLGLPRGVQKLDVRIAKVNRITSAVNSSLQLTSTTFTYLKGSEGTHIRGKHITFKADQDILLKTVNGNIVISGKDGVHLNVHDLPLVRETGVTRKSYTTTSHGKKEAQYQLCICMPEGNLFRVEIPVNNHSRPPKQRVGCHSPKNPPC